MQHEDPGDEVDQHQRRPGDHLRDRVPVLGRLAPDQAVVVAGLGVDAGRDPVAEPGREPGQQRRTRHEQDDLEALAPRPVTDVVERGDGRHVPIFVAATA